LCHLLLLVLGLHINLAVLLLLHGLLCWLLPHCDLHTASRTSARCCSCRCCRTYSPSSNRRCC
jgi:hypothetical protein